MDENGEKYRGRKRSIRAFSRELERDGYVTAFITEDNLSLDEVLVFSRNSIDWLAVKFDEMKEKFAWGKANFEEFDIVNVTFQRWTEQIAK